MILKLILIAIFVLFILHQSELREGMSTREQYIKAAREAVDQNKEALNKIIKEVKGLGEDADKVKDKMPSDDAMKFEPPR